MNSISISGYKSFKAVDLKLNPINILIGANGSGKSNFLSFFEMLHCIYEKRLMAAIAEYDKVVYGSILAEETGLSTIRSRCPLFNTWIERIEEVSNK